MYMSNPDELRTFFCLRQQVVMWLQLPSGTRLGFLRQIKLASLKVITHSRSLSYASYLASVDCIINAYPMQVPTMKKMLLCMCYHYNYFLI